jgi:hypothetical protein
MGKFGKENTLMLESDEINVYDCHRNSLIIDRYTRDDVWPTEVGNGRNQLEILTTIKDDLMKLLDSCEGDIQEHLQTAEFSEYLRQAQRLQPLGDLI